MSETQHRVLDFIKGKKLVIFDFDGTISNTEPLSWEAHNLVLWRYGFTLTEQHIKKYIGNSDKDIIEMIEEDFNCQIDTEVYMEQRNAIYKELISESDLLPNPTIEQLLREGIYAKVVLLTSNSLSNVMHLLHKWDLTRAFDDFVSVSDLGITKGYYFGSIPRKWGVDYSEVVIFEDSAKVISEAKRRRITTVGVEHQYNRGALTECDLLIKEPLTSGATE